MALNPVTYVDERGVNLFVIEGHVPVFNLMQASIVFTHNSSRGIHVWGMKPPVTNLLLSYQDAVEFFGQTSEKK